MSRSSKHIYGAAAAICLAASATLGLANASANTPAITPAQVQLDMGTLHAAALSKARTARDSADAPYLLVTVFGPGNMKTSMQLPSANQHWAINRNEAKGATPLTTLIIAPGDSVRVLFTLLEAEQVNAAQESSVGTALSQLNFTSGKSSTALAPTLSPLTTAGANWIGSGALLLTNEGGKTYWRALDCVSTCTVSSSPVKAANESELAPNATNALAGVLELNGNAATYHLQVNAKRSM